MNNVKEALKRIVYCCRRTMNLAEVFAYDQDERHNNIFDDIYGDLMDSLYYLCDQKTDTLPESIVYMLIKDDSLSEEEVAEKLAELVKISEN